MSKTSAALEAQGGSPLAPARGSAWKGALPLLVLGIAVVLLFLSAPYRADMWWSDAPRHAMDGAFFRDLFRDMPVGHLKEYAMNYYLQYPALATLFYPPLFPLIEAIFFAIFGISSFSAQLAVATFYLAAAWGAYFLMRRWLEPPAALAVSLLFVGSPEVALWGRQVMLEIPACAFLIWSAVVFLRYLDQGKTRMLYSSVLLLVAGAYTKQTVLFILPVIIGILWMRKGRSILKDRQIWGSAILFILLLIPLAWLSLTFASLNANSVTGGAWTQIPVFSLRGWSFYLRQFPSQVGWVTFVLAVTGLILGILRRHLQRGEEAFFAGWLAVGYIFFSLIALKEPRHTVLILLPLAFFAIRGIVGLLPARIGPPVAVAFAVVTLGHTLLRAEVPEMHGYREAVDYVAKHAPPNSVVLFSGYRDGPFVFDMRTREDRRDLSVLRADKLLLRVTQRRELGVDELDVTPVETGEMLNRYGVKYIVSQPNFWDDLKNMQMLQNVLHTPQFRLVATIPVVSNVNHTDRKLEIYENLGTPSRLRERIRLELPIIGVFVEGPIGGTK
jgi:Dolichyl-phosphate-mannose-protein mannosyltransferase